MSFLHIYKSLPYVEKCRQLRRLPTNELFAHYLQHSAQMDAHSIQTTNDLIKARQARLRYWYQWSDDLTELDLAILQRL